ncbi:hypothetical protein Esti_005746 [Eimeria stiedai]
MMDENALDIEAVLRGFPRPPGIFSSFYFSSKRSLLAFLIRTRLLHLPKTQHSGIVGPALNRREAEGSGDDDSTCAPSSSPSEPQQQQQQERRRKRVVVVGGGWASAAVVMGLDPAAFEVIWISDNPLFSFSPLLPSCVGGVLPPSACSVPLRALLMLGGDPSAVGYFREGSLQQVDLKRKCVACRKPQQQQQQQQQQPQQQQQMWEEPYDVLVLGIGSRVSLLGVAGASEFGFTLKTVQDAQAIRRRLAYLLEAASLPTASEKEKRQLLTFVVVGGGPSGVEAAAELQDLLAEEARQVYRHLEEYMRVVVVESGSSLLSSYLPKIRAGAIRTFVRSSIQVLFNTRAVELQRDRITVKPSTPEAAAAAAALTVTAAGAGTAAGAAAAAGGTAGTDGLVSLPCGFVLLTTGVVAAEAAQTLAASLPEQGAAGRLLVDPALRVWGTEGVFALGDCAQIKPPSLARCSKNLYALAAKGDPQGLADPLWLWRHKSRLSFVFPQLFDGEGHVLAFKKNSRLNATDFEKLLEAIDASYIPPVSTAANAFKEGQHLALLLNFYFSRVPPPRAGGKPSQDATGTAATAAGERSAWLGPLPAYSELRGVGLCFLGSGHAALQLPFMATVGASVDEDEHVRLSLWMDANCSLWAHTPRQYLKPIYRPCSSSNSSSSTSSSGKCRGNSR